MRDYVFSEVRSRQAYGQLTFFVRVLRNWKQRKDLKRLMAMDDRMLRDIGLDRSTVQHLLDMRLTADWQWERERVRRR